ncbi:MAG: DUF177 domain-containing protein [Actinomycetota bacterium]
MRSGRIDAVTVVETTVADDGRVEIEATLEESTGDVSLHGTVRAGWEAPCRRCGDDLAGSIEVSVVEIFTRDHVEGETYPLEGDEIDLAPLVRDVVTLELPFAPGPPLDGEDRCTICGRDAPGEPEDDGDGAAEPTRDPRWAVLDQLDLPEE